MGLFRFFRKFLYFFTLLLLTNAACNKGSAIAKPIVANFFTRLAENSLLLNVPGVSLFSITFSMEWYRSPLNLIKAGSPELSLCCHSGCDNCPYARTFDEMRSTRPKWIPFYTEMQFMDGRHHKSKWFSDIFASNHDAVLTKAELIHKLWRMPIQDSTLGIDIPIDDVCNIKESDFKERISTWLEIHSKDNEKDKITPFSFEQFLKSRCNQEYGGTFRDFCKDIH